VSDPSCTVKPTFVAPVAGADPATSITVKVTASPAALVGPYVVTVTGLDPAVSTLSQTTAALPVYVVGVTNSLTLAPGATGPANAVFNTVTAPKPDTLVSFSCGQIEKFVDGLPSGTPTSSAGLLACGGPASAPVTGGATTVPITIQPIATAASVKVSNSMTLAAFLGLPLFAIVGWLGSRKSPRKNFFRFLGLILLLVGASCAATGCGGSFNQPGGGGTSALAGNSYLVQVVAKDPAGNPYYAVVPLTVNQ